MQRRCTHRCGADYDHYQPIIDFSGSPAVNKKKAYQLTNMPFRYLPDIIEVVLLPQLIQEDPFQYFLNAQV